MGISHLSLLFQLSSNIIYGGIEEMTPQRKKAENLIYDYMQILDPSGTNTAYYKNLFSGMNDSEFKKWCERDLPIRFHIKPFVIEPSMAQVKESLDFLNVPLCEKVALPYLYEDNNGNPVWSNDAIVIYIHLKKMKQFILKKNNVTADIDIRDFRRGRLTSHDKGGVTSDRETEALASFNLDKTMEELMTIRADAMDAKSVAYATIATKGNLSQEDYSTSREDSLARNMLNYYMLASGLYTNILNVDYMLPRTIEDKTRRVDREV